MNTFTFPAPLKDIPLKSLELIPLIANPLLPLRFQAIDQTNHSLLENLTTVVPVVTSAFQLLNVVG